MVHGLISDLFKHVMLIGRGKIICRSNYFQECSAHFASSFKPVEKITITNQFSTGCAGSGKRHWIGIKENKETLPWHLKSENFWKLLDYWTNNWGSS